MLGALLAVCAGLIVGGRVAIAQGYDFASLYEMGHGLLNGINVYTPEVAATFRPVYDVDVPAGMFYPPATGFTMLPLAVLPYQVGKLAWLLIVDLAVIFGVRSLIRSLSPASPSYVWVGCAGAILLSSALRWAMILQQGSPLVLGLLCWFAAAINDGRTRLATGLAILAVSAKMTLSVPFLGILLLQRRFGAALASGGTWLALNVIGFWRMGPGSYHDYQRAVVKLEALGDINSPDPWALASNPRLDWTSLFYGLTGNLRVSRLATLACAAAVSLWLLREGLRAAKPLSFRSTALFLPPLVCLGSLCVYHHHYDAPLFFAPVLVLLFGFDWRKLHWSVWLLVPFLALMLLVPIGGTQAIAQALMGDRGVGLFKLSFPIVVSLALVGSLILLRIGERDRIEPKPH